MNQEGNNFIRADLDVGENTTDLFVTDFNGDGKPDLVTLSLDQGQMWVSLAESSFEGSALSTSVVNNVTVERHFTYDPVFNQLTSFTDELGRQTFYEIDPNNGNTLSMTQVIGQLDTQSNETDDIITHYTYTSSGLIDTVTDPLGRMTDYDYDGLGRQIKTTYALGTVDEAFVQYEYDLAGNQTAIIDENGYRTEFEYDPLNRLVKTIYAVGTLNEAVERIEYDQIGNQTAMMMPMAIARSLSMMP